MQRGGSRVLARYDDGHYYAGRVASQAADGLVIKFDDGDTAIVSPGSVLTIGSPCVAAFQNGDLWFEGVIRQANGDGTFAIEYSDGDKESCVPAGRILPRYDDEDNDQNGSQVQDDVLGHTEQRPRRRRRDASPTPQVPSAASSVRQPALTSTERMQPWTSHVASVGSLLGVLGVLTLIYSAAHASGPSAAALAALSFLGCGLLGRLCAACMRYVKRRRATRASAPQPVAEPAQHAFRWGEPSTGGALVRSILARDEPVVLRLTGLPSPDAFEAEMRRTNPVWRNWVDGRSWLDTSEPVLANLDREAHPAGVALWHGVCTTLGLRGESPLGGATVVASHLGGVSSGSHPRRGSFSTRCHWHVPSVCNLALLGTARKRYLLVPWRIAVECGMDEDPSRSLVHAEEVLARLGSRAAECWVATIGAGAQHNVILWPMRMLHHVWTFRGEDGTAGRTTDSEGSRQPDWAVEGAEEGPRRSLYLGIGTYVFDHARMPPLVEALREASAASPSWRAHFGTERACSEFTEWYARW